MTILQALARRYERMDGAPAEGFAPAKIHFTLVLRPDGSLARVEDERQLQGRKLMPRDVAAPEAPKDRRGEKIVAGFFWDPVEYALGVYKPDTAATGPQAEKAVRKAAEKHEAFKALHRRILDGNEDAGARALLSFLSRWDPTTAAEYLPEAALGGVAVLFRMDDELRYLHDRPALKLVVATALAAAELKNGLCLVTGERTPIARLHAPIKGVGEKLAPLVSFNEDAFNSYGRTKGDNAPVSQAVSFAYATALNGLLSAISGRGEKGEPRWSNRVRLGDDTTVVFWADTTAAEVLLGAMASGPPPADDSTETAEVRDVLQALQDGRTLADSGFNVDPSTRVYLLGLSPNAARLSLRFWREDSLGEIAERFREHWNDLKLELASGGTPPVWRLLLELAAQRKPENVSPHLAGEMMRAILTGTRYPASMLAQTVMRIRADQDRPDPKNPARTLEKVSRLRVAMMKAWLARDARKLGQKEDLVALDLANTNTAYRLGRLFAVLERLQGAALGQRNATVRDRFYAAASATPERVFPTLIRNAGNHLKKVRSSAGGGLVNWYETHIAETLSAVQEYPKALDLRDQGRFGIGYYHQREALFQKTKEDKTVAEAEVKAQAAAEDPSNDNGD